jgi:hypothetical protein
MSVSRRHFFREWLGESARALCEVLPLEKFERVLDIGRDSPGAVEEAGLALAKRNHKRLPGWLTAAGAPADPSGPARAAELSPGDREDAQGDSV